jgi:hypothetical protein
VSASPRDRAPHNAAAEISPADGPPGRPWPRIGPVRRFGPSLLVAAALITAGTVATFHDRARATSAIGQSKKKSPSHHSSSNPADNPELPIFYAQAKAAGKKSDYKWQQGCNYSTGRLDIPSEDAPPCVPAFNGANGGNTWPGVTPTTIRLVYYMAPPGDLTAAVPGATDTPTEVIATVEADVAEFNQIFETYGRKVDVIIFNATGTSTDAVAAKADAFTAADQLHAFASIGGPAQTAVYEDELAHLHVLCIGCGVSVPYSSFQADAPYLWSGFTSTDLLLSEAFRFIIGELLGKDASDAGDPAYRHEKRVFGFVHYDQNPPVFGSLAARLDKELAGTGFKAKVTESYLLVLDQLQSEAAAIVSKLKAAGITTVIFAGDPIMPIYLTSAAAAQDYYPEWVITGTVFTDTSTLGRLYNQKEWAHAFGISTLGVPTTIEISSGWTMYRWYYGTLPPAIKTSSVILAGISEFYTGIELAGPKLTPYTFEGGLFKYPPSGGTASSPLIAFGYHAPPPTPSFSSPDDYTVIWWDANAVGPDEEGIVGKGLFRYVNGGARIGASGYPRQNLHLFDPAGTVTRFSTLPAVANQDAPPWPSSPAATHG